MPRQQKTAGAFVVWKCNQAGAQKRVKGQCPLQGAGAAPLLGFGATPQLFVV